MGVADISFALSSYITNTGAFFIAASFGRLFQGAAESFICVTIFSIIAIQFPKKTELYTGYLELASGTGCTLGPILTSVLSAYTDFAGTFFIFGLFIILAGFVPTYILPSKLDETAE